MFTRLHSVKTADDALCLVRWMLRLRITSITNITNITKTNISMQCNAQK
jgi:hypothetical protein